MARSTSPAKRPRPTAEKASKRPAEASPDRRTILDTASRLLVDGGPEALTMRRLATDAGTSTMVLYTRFGGRDGLLDALLAEGFGRFADALGAVHLPDPEAHLLELGRAYRRFAQANPTYYRLMWGGATAKDWDRASNTLAQQHGQRAFGSLVHAVTRVLALDDRPARDAEPLAMCVWSAVHGFVSLEVACAVPPGVDANALYERTLRFTVDGLRAR